MSLTARTLAELKPPQPTLWVRDGAIIIPVPDPKSATFYDIELRRIDTPLKLLAWTAHLASKPWMGGRRLKEFINVAAKAQGFELPHQL